MGLANKKHLRKPKPKKPVRRSNPWCSVWPMCDCDMRGRESDCRLNAKHATTMRLLDEERN